MTKSVTDKQWREWGKRNPYFGVLGLETSAIERGQLETTFWSSGEQHIASVIDSINHHFGGLKQASTALDFGCGVGRLVLPLTRRFARVTGVDVSPAMLQVARMHLADVPNVDFVENLAALEANQRYDLVHSYIVIQHIRPRQGYPIIVALLDRVAPGGFFALHMTIGDLRLTRRVLNSLRYRIPPLHWAYNIVRGRPWREPVAEMNRYDFARLMQLVKGQYQEALAVREFDHNGHVGVFIIGQKRSVEVHDRGP